MMRFLYLPSRLVHKLPRWSLALCFIGSPSLHAGESDLPERILFNRDVRPFMSNTCFKCHGRT